MPLLGPEKTILDTLERHRSAWRQLSKLAERVDGVLADRQNRKIRIEDEFAYDEADLAERKAMARLLSLRPATPESATAVLEYLEPLNPKALSDDAAAYFENLLLLVTSRAESNIA